MEIFGNIVIYIIVACFAVGAVTVLIKPKSEIGKEFLKGFDCIGPIFLTIAGIMAAIPYLAKFVDVVLGPLFALFGADPSMGASILAPDMGGYWLAEGAALTGASWMVTVFASYMLGACIVFTIPVGLGMISEKSKKWFGLGILSGVLCIPVGIFISGVISIATNPSIPASTVFTGALNLGFGELLLNLIPVTIICLLIAAGLFFIPKVMMKGFSGFGRFIEIAARIVLVFTVIEYFTGVFSAIFGVWGFDAIIADEKDMMRALEVAGYVGLMLAGAFPMVWLMQKYLKKPISRLGKLCNLSETATTGLLGASANALAMFPLMDKVNPRERVMLSAFTVCGAYIIGDHLAFAANFHASYILPIFIGKLVAGVLSVIVAAYIFKLYCKKEKTNPADLEIEEGSGKSETVSE